MAKASPDQAKPFAPSSTFPRRSDDEEALTTTSTKFRQRKCIKICGCITAFLLILAVAILILSFTVFHVKQPEIKMNRIIISPFYIGSQFTTNLTFVADVSVKNPNIASFKFDNGTTTVFHDGEVIGEGISPAGVAKARKTIELDVTVFVNPEKLMEIPDLMDGMKSDSVSMNSSTVIGGTVKILMIKKYIKVQVNCSIDVIYDFRGQEIQENCISHFI
ncbi:uncharacterized protein [Euphorbia lathyris]|uniref:uncharacterized protein n=1 Tax=Euphorbia lathyris TaxID=212925 RepID=UPI0033131E10